MPMVATKSVEQIYWTCGYRKKRTQDAADSDYCSKLAELHTM